MNPSKRTRGSTKSPPTSAPCGEPRDTRPALATVAAVASRFPYVPSPRPPAAGATRPRPAPKGKPFGIPWLCFRWSLQARQAVFIGALRPPQTLTVLRRTGPHVRAPGRAVRHSGRELPPRLAARGGFPSSPPGARTPHPSPVLAPFHARRGLRNRPAYVLSPCQNPSLRQAPLVMNRVGLNAHFGPPV